MILTVEQVSRWHPDKIADQISDNILARVLTIEPRARVAIETLVKDRTVFIAGEIGGVQVDDQILKDAAKEIMNNHNYVVESIVVQVSQQSKEIADAVILESTTTAGDQGIMVGYATKESPSYLPWGMHRANEIIKRLEFIASLGYIQGDAKCQVTYDSQTLELIHVVISACMSPKFNNLDRFRAMLASHMGDIAPSALTTINPAGTWYIGGPEADAGLTGRKIVADQYGPRIPVGGGAFSGKDLSKVDRSAAYAARNIAIDVLKTFDVEWVLIQLAYQIGYATPVAVSISSSHRDVNSNIEKWIKRFYNLTPDKMIERLRLTPEDYPKLAQGCHYRDGYVGNWT
jgi:S-adenosylmethionine synthetase